MIMKLILFDVDGTLVSRVSIGEDAFVFAIKKVFNVNVKKPGDEFDGWTDKGIIFELLEEVGINRKEITKNLDEIYKNIVDYVKKNVDRVKDFKLFPGVKKLLEKLDKEGCIVGLLTGNIEGKARIKMRKFGIDHFFKVEAFGGVTENRNELVPIAIKQAEKKFKIKIRKEDVFIVGDTTRDVQCGKDNGVKTIAVCTGKYTRNCLLYTSPSPRDRTRSRMPSSA